MSEMKTQQTNVELSTDDISDAIAPDMAGKLEALEIVLPLGVDRARLILRKYCESLKRLQEHQEQEQEQEQEQRRRDKKDESSLPRGCRENLQIAVRTYQSLYGPLGGRLGQSVLPALYLNDQWSRFSAWLAGCNIDPSACRTWVNEKLSLLKAMQAVNGLDVEDIETDEKNLDSRSTGHGKYGKEGSQMLAGLFLLNNQDDYTSWLQRKKLSFGRPMAWAERQAEEFRGLIGPDVEIPEYKYPGME